MLKKIIYDFQSYCQAAISAADNGQKPFLTVLLICGVPERNNAVRSGSAMHTGDSPSIVLDSLGFLFLVPFPHSGCSWLARNFTEQHKINIYDISK